MKTPALIVLLLFLFGFATHLPAQTRYEPTWASVDSRPTPAWFTDAKFGIFIHWGVYSVPAWGPTPKDGASIYDCYSEWYWNKLLNKNSKVNHLFVKFHNETYGPDVRYQDFVKDFTCELFDPDQWASVFKASGAKYVVLTSKHHEGFTLWPSAQAWNWNAVDVGPHRDLAGDLSAAVKKAGLHMGFYYSLYEWFNPLYHADVNRYVDQHMIPQMKDLVTRYEPDIVWTDGEWDHPSETWKSTEFLAWLFNESPVKNSVVINDRWGKETRSKHGGIYTTEYDLIHDGNAREQTIDHPWEECRGIGSSFGYNRNEALEDYNSSEALVHTLIEKVARGGNLLLDIGPTADGRIPVIMQQRLADIGAWLAVNGDAIYGTTKWAKAPALTKESTVFFTQKGKDLYVITTRWPEKAISVAVPKAPKAVSLMGFTGKVTSTYSGGKLTLQPPAVTPANSPCNYAWVFRLENVL